MLAVLLSLTARPLLDGSAQHARNKPVAFAVLEDYDKGDDLQAVARDFALMRELDVHTWRGSFGWDDYEPGRGQTDFAWLEQFITLARREGITLRPYIGYTPEWAGRKGTDADRWNDPPRSLGEWASFLSRLVAMLARHPNVASVEIYNEQNVQQWWDGTVDDYRRVLERGAAIVARAPRRIGILPGGLVYADPEWVEKVCAAPGLGRQLTAVALHAYPETWTPPHVTIESYLDAGFDAFVAEADAACGRKPIWINETGFATTPGKSESDQAVWWVRAVATFLAHPRVEQIGIYELKDLAPDRPAIGDAPNYHLGLTYADRRKKLAFATVDLLTDLLDTGTLTVADESLSVEIQERSDVTVFKHLFVRPDGRQVAFVWIRGAPATATIGITRPARTAVAYGLDGSRGAPQPLVDGALRGVALRDGDVHILLFE